MFCCYGLAFESFEDSIPLLLDCSFVAFFHTFEFPVADVIVQVRLRRRRYRLAALFLITNVPAYEMYSFAVILFISLVEQIIL